VSQQFQSVNPPFNPGAQAVSAGAESSVRQLIANGKEKAALERAKEIHKMQRSAASEVLLVEAYAARINFLLRQNLAMEAKALLDLVRERYPSSRARLDELTAPAAARAGGVEELVQPLNDPALTAERRAVIEQAIQREVWDLGALGGCAALSSDDPLRQAASALQRAFLAVTNGPVDEESLARRRCRGAVPSRPGKCWCGPSPVFIAGRMKPAANTSTPSNPMRRRRGWFRRFRRCWAARPPRL